VRARDHPVFAVPTPNCARSHDADHERELDLRRLELFTDTLHVGWAKDSDLEQASIVPRRIFPACRMLVSSSWNAISSCEFLPDESSQHLEVGLHRLLGVLGAAEHHDR
jgi:hypothetical protein